MANDHSFIPELFSTLKCITHHFSFHSSLIPALHYWLDLAPALRADPHQHGQHKDQVHPSDNHCAHGQPEGPLSLRRHELSGMLPISVFRYYSGFTVVWLTPVTYVGREEWGPDLHEKNY